MMANCCVKNEKPVKSVMKNDTKCSICKNMVFRVDRITAGLIRLICETCGETYMIGSDMNEKGAQLLFWDSETEDIQQ
jgi:ribosomal protein L37AE/L43A